MLLSHLNLLATAPGGVARLRELILTLAVQGKLVPQDPKDEPASELLQRVATSAAVRAVKIIKAKGGKDEIAAPYGLPDAWAWSRLGDIVENMGSGWSPACDEGERIDQTRWAVLRTTAVQVNEYRAREHKVIPAKLSPRPEIEVKDGDILITRAGPMNRVGISCWVNNTPPRLMLSDKIVRFHSIADEMLPAFIVLALNAGWTKGQIEKAKTGMAASQVNISQSDLRAFWLPVCSRVEQSRIVTRVEELMRLCDALEAKAQLAAAQHTQLVSTLLGTLTQSETPEQLADNWRRIATHFDLLLDRPETVDALEQTIFGLAMRGLLVAQDWNDEPTVKVVKRIAERRKQTRMKGVAGDSGETDTGSFSLPQSWAWCSVEQIATVCLGGTPARQEPSYWNGMIPWVSSGEVANGRISDTKEKITPAGLANSNAKVYPKNTILIAMIGQGKTRGQSAILDIEACTNQNVAGLILDPEAANPDFIFLWALHEYVRTRSGGRGGAQPALNGAIVRSLKVPLPPLAEQSRIVTRVESLRRLCADLRQRLAASQSTQAHLAEALVEKVALATH